MKNNIAEVGYLSLCPRRMKSVLEYAIRFARILIRLMTSQ